MILQLSRSDADVFVPDGLPEDEALARVTHLGIGAHADDLEIMAYHGIREGNGRNGPGFGAVVCTNGAGAPRPHEDADPDGRRLRDTRRREQRTAAQRGRYALAIQLGHPSEDVREGVAPELVEDLARVLELARPEVVYTHSPSDAHATHVGVCVAVIDAIRRLSPEARPLEVLGCEVWGSLDWLPRDIARALALGDDGSSWSALVQIFASQTGARPYHEGALGRSRANAVFREADAVGGEERLWLAMDLTPLALDDALDLADYVEAQVARFASAVRTRITTARGR